VPDSGVYPHRLITGRLSRPPCGGTDTDAKYVAQ